MAQSECRAAGHILRLSVARAGGQLGMNDFAVQQYRHLISRTCLDMVVDDLQDLLLDVSTICRFSNDCIEHSAMFIPSRAESPKRWTNTMAARRVVMERLRMRHIVET
jgi:hypothetical protein